MWGGWWWGLAGTSLLSMGVNKTSEASAGGLLISHLSAPSMGALAELRWVMEAEGALPRL